MGRRRVRPGLGMRLPWEGARIAASPDPSEVHREPTPLRYPRIVSKKKRSIRPRTEQRELARRHEKLWEAREKLALLEPGGSPDRPLEVRSASVVEARAESEPCLRCGQAMRCEDHSALKTRTGVLRVAKLRCRACGATRELYLRILESFLN